MKPVHTLNTRNLVAKLAESCDHGAILQALRLLALKAPAIARCSILITVSKRTSNTSVSRLGLLFRGSELYSIRISAKNGRDGEMGGARMLLNS